MLPWTVTSIAIGWAASNAVFGSFSVTAGYAPTQNVSRSLIPVRGPDAEGVFAESAVRGDLERRGQAVFPLLVEYELGDRDPGVVGDDFLRVGDVLADDDYSSSVPRCPPRGVMTLRVGDAALSSPPRSRGHRGKRKTVGPSC